jgi:hypothetical protein
MKSIYDDEDEYEIDSFEDRYNNANDDVITKEDQGVLTSDSEDDNNVFIFCCCIIYLYFVI